MPPVALRTPATPATTLRDFFKECLVIVCISYPILLLLLSLSPGVLFTADISLLFLLALTAVSTTVVSTLLSLALFIGRRHCGCFDDEESDAFDRTPMMPRYVAVDEKAAVRSHPTCAPPATSVPTGVLVELEKA